MMNSKKFLTIFLVTIAVIRLLLYFTPRTSFLYTDKLHHIYLGLTLLLIYFLVKITYLLPISLGLIADELSLIPFYIAELLNKSLAIHPFNYYWSPYSLISTPLIIIISIVLIKKYSGD